MVFASTAMAQYRPYTLTVVDESGLAVTDTTTMAVYIPGTSTSETVYADNNKTAIGTNLTSRRDGNFKFWCDLPAVDLQVTNVTSGKIVKVANCGQTGQIVLSRNQTLAEGSSLYNACKTARVTIGYVGSSGYTYSFTTAANTTPQSIDCGAIIPANARILDVSVINTQACVFSGGATTFTGSLGLVSSGTLIMNTTTLYALASAGGSTIATAPLTVISSSAQHIFFTATPGANWSTMTAGSFSLLVTYVNLDAIKQ